MKFPHWPGLVTSRVQWLYDLLLRKYGFDEFNEIVFAGGARKLGRLLWSVGDVKIIDGFFVNGSARVVGMFSAAVRRIQSGYVNQYAFAMIIGLFLLLTLFLHG
jgi:NADH-quinone oxidoreductase subunit L